ncbi:BEN domain-containing protein 5-like isoform X1 [Amblyomma americanum]
MKRQKQAWKGRAQELQESELEKEKEYWKSRAQELQDDNVFLKAQVASLQRCLESKIFQLEQQGKAHYSRGMTTAPPVAAADEDLVGRKYFGFSCNSLHLKTGGTVIISIPFLTLEPLEIDNTAPSKCAPLPCLSAATEAEERTSSPGEEQQQQHFLTPPAPTGEFCYMEDGSFHLKKGIVISGACAEKIFKNKKPTLVIKDTAQAIWGNDVLVTRSVTGTACSKKRALGELPKQPLTPEKLLVVSETLKYWGVQKSVSTEEAEKTLTRTLTEKIQDLLKSKLRRQIKF